MASPDGVSDLLVGAGVGEALSDTQHPPLRPPGPYSGWITSPCLPGPQLRGPFPEPVRPPHLSWLCNLSRSLQSCPRQPDRTGIG